jgi:hypothetical protein
VREEEVEDPEVEEEGKHEEEVKVIENGDQIEEEEDDQPSNLSRKQY